MIFFLINRFRRKKLRARENRQTAEDQRSIVGSIGYIAGNMGYMEGNLSSMDYTYGGAAHYPLWKPPSGYFPRGEAPPPYDEAVAISQAEALSAQCAAAAAVAQVAAANQRAALGMNSVELQTDMNRRAQAQQMQQIQHHQQPQMSHQNAHVVPIQAHVLAPAQPQSQNQSQSHQITQSTTNLINININSGGNITTIATGENHQPPYSLQDDNNTGATLIQGQQAAAIMAGNVGGNNSGSASRVHIAQSNSICVQTMTPVINQQQQMSTNQQPSTTQSVLQPAQIMTSTLAANTATLSRQRDSGTQQQHIGVSSNSNDCGYKNCHLNVANVATSTVSRRLHRTTEPPLQQYVVDVEVNVANNSGSGRGYHSLPPCSNATAATEAEETASPTQFGNISPSLTSAISTPAIDVDDSNGTNEHVTLFTSPNTENQIQMPASGHNTLPLQHSQTNKSSTNSTTGSSKISSSSSSKRYHRTMPRYYAVADPLSQNVSGSGKTKESKLSANSSVNSNASSSASSNASSSTKKPTCQCPVQHVPMSYMGSTQLSNAQNATNNAFFTVLSSKLNPNSSASNSPSPSQHSSSRLQANNSNTNSLSYQQRSTKSSQSSSSMDNNVINSASNTMKRSTNSSHCNYEGKIATISTGELTNPSTTQPQPQQQQQHHHHGHSHHHGGHGHHSSSLILPPQHHDDSSPIVLGRVTKRSSSSSGDRLRSASSTRASMVDGATSPAAAAYLNSKVDAYLSFAHGTATGHHLKAYNNDIMNPALPPKLHKSLTNLKSSSSPSSTSSAGGNNTHQHNTSTSNNTTTTTNVVATSNATHRNSSHHKSNDLNTNSNNTSSQNNTTIVLNCNNTINNSSYSNNSTNSNHNPSNHTMSSTYNMPSSVAAASTNCSSSSTTSVQTIYTLSKPSSTSAAATSVSIIGLTTTSCTASTTPSSNRSMIKDHHDHIMKIQPPSLTLPLSTTSTTSSFTSSTSKINSSTFYPLQNNVTYTLPKNVGGGKMSLNSTINSVVSKVPSVISLPPSGTEQNNNYNGYGGNYSGYGNTNTLCSDNSYNSHQYLNEMNGGGGGGGGGGTSSTAATTSKSTTLPKILRSKRDVQQHNNVHNSSNINCNPTNISTSSNYAVSQCSMPAYPKQYAAAASSNSGGGGSATASSSSSMAGNNSNSSPHQQLQQPPTNINNMQTQTITSTLAANYCPEDSHLNAHSIGCSNNATINHHSTTTNRSISPSTSNNILTKQLPVCTTSKNCLNPKEHFLPNDTSLDDDYLSECENCKIAQSSKYYLNAEALSSVGGPQETMTLQRKSLEECKEEPDTGYYRISHTLPTNSKKNAQK
ncbi:uncharacterized protein LOC142220698 isoform X2 [Haematobia irritans]|uniref:uncharacterized protein LOC142220698 isoform X2 n=1 Tax=Haematobia irritans TaxID=7368 RepID=UPI003F5091EF